MVLQRWYPFGDVRRLESRMSRLFRGVPLYEPEAASWPVPLDVVRGGDDIVVRASLPGVKPEDVHVAIEDGVLNIKAESTSETETEDGGYLLRERRTGSFHRTLRLPDSVDADKVRSEYANGVLSITFPKEEAKKAKVIEVKAA